jgi:hypothetical protein
MFGAYVKHKETVWFLHVLWREIVAGRYQMPRMNTGVHSRDLTDEHGGLSILESQSVNYVSHFDVFR